MAQRRGAVAGEHLPRPQPDLPPGVLPGKIRGDARLREELAYCVPGYLPHSRFKSWSDDDQDKALAYLREKALTCSGCGTRRDEWEDLPEDPDGDPELPYIAVNETCPGCLAIEELQGQIDQGSRGVKIGLVPRETYFANRDQYERE